MGNGADLSLHTLASELSAQRVADHMQVIDKARVPIVKFRDAMSNVDVDISFNMDSGLECKRFFKPYFRMYPHLQTIAVVVKFFLAQVTRRKKRKKRKFF